jgi:hypothetical protein
MLDRIKNYLFQAKEKLAETTEKISPEAKEEDFYETAPTEIEKAKAQFVDWVALVVPFALGSLLAISNGYLFAGFKNFSLDTTTFVAWMSGFAIEAAALAALFHSSDRLKRGHKKEFWLSFSGALILASISLVAQYVYLQMEYKTGSLKINDQAVDQMPIFSLLLGVNGFKGHDILFVVRSFAYHIAEFVCSFLITKKGTTVAAALQRKREIFEYKSQVSQQESILALSETIQKGIQDLMGQQQQVMQVALQKALEQLAAPEQSVNPLALPLLNPQASQQSNGHQSLNGSQGAKEQQKK